MKKLNISLLLFLSAFLMSFPVLGQNQIGISEIQIKKSGIYFWGQSYNIDSTQAILESRDELIAQITEQIDNNTNLNSNSDIIVKNINYFPKKMEGIYKIIAYVEKDFVKNVLIENPTMNIVSIKYSDKSEIQSDTTNIIPIIHSDTLNNFKKETDQTVTLLDRFIQCNTGQELRDLIITQEKENTIVYNWNSKAYQQKVSSDAFYIVLIDPETKAIVAFLDKGNEIRKNLKAPHNIFKINNELIKYIQVWIQIL